MSELCVCPLYLCLSDFGEAEDDRRVLLIEEYPGEQEFHLVSQFFSVGLTSSAF